MVYYATRNQHTTMSSNVCVSRIKPLLKPLRDLFLPPPSRRFGHYVPAAAAPIVRLGWFIHRMRQKLAETEGVIVGTEDDGAKVL